MVYAAATCPCAFKGKTAAQDYFTKLSIPYRSLTDSAAGSNDFHRIAKAIEDLDKSMPMLAANSAAPSGGAASQ